MIPSSFEPFLEKAPLSVLARAALINLFDPERLDQLFEDNAETQYHRLLLFSDLHGLMLNVVMKYKSSVYAAYRHAALAVSHQAVYDKLSRIDDSVTEALVADSAEQVRATMKALGVTYAEPIPGLRARIVDGNRLSKTERRIGPLRAEWARGLPGIALVVYEPRVDLVTHAFLERDSHAGERTRLPDVLELAEANDLWIADANFCTHEIFARIRDAQGYFLIRHHAKMTGKSVGKRRRIGRTKTGTVSEEAFELAGPNDGWVIRRVTLVLDTPTRDGVKEIHVLTNVPATIANAIQLLAAYRDRWQIERRFFDMAQTLGAEPQTLGHPPAALFAFGLGLVASNALALIHAALASVHSPEAVDEVSAHYLAEEIRETDRGLMIAIPTQNWTAMRVREPAHLAQLLHAIAKHVKLSRYKKATRGPKKPPPKKSRYQNGMNLSNQRLLDQWKGKKLLL